jgi:UDP-N-acetylmuramoyl-L-alanyl-D-glutamate--2,6-diaminopimelate ligase
VIDCGQDFSVIVDFAHTPDSLKKLLETVKTITQGRLLLVFGCPGDRDKGKRPIMGEIAAQLADFSIITTDDPHKEAPARILEEIEMGMIKGAGVEGKNYLVMEGRKTAIRKIIEMAHLGDTVVIAGRGHETSQDFAGVKVEIDDREVVKEILNALPSPPTP